MASYTNIFGGTLVQPAYVSYRSIDLDVPTLTLYWPSSFLDATQVTAALMDVSSSVNENIIVLPSAKEVSVGQPLIFRNIGETSFLVNDNTGGNILNILSGTIWYVYLTNNTTDAGIWKAFQYGTGTSSADANALAGFGLKVLGGTLNTEFSSIPINANHPGTPEDRSKFFIYTGGAGTFTMPSVASIDNGFFFSVNNASEAGALTFVTTDGSSIEGNASFTLDPGESAIFVTNKINWFTLGYGRINTNVINVLNKDLTGLPSPVTLTPSEANTEIHQFYGTLTTNVTINYAPFIPFIYYISNQTNGAYQLILTIPGSVSNITLDTGASVIVYSDGTNLYSVPTTLPGSQAFINGNVGSPSIRFVGDLTSGYYYNTFDNSLGTSIGGVEVIDVSANGLQTSVPINSDKGGYDEFGVNIYSLIRAYSNAG